MTNNQINTILIANRGEIQLIAIHTNREMRKTAVAVYSTTAKEAH